MKIKLFGLFFLLLVSCSSQKYFSQKEQNQVSSPVPQDIRSDMQLTEEQYVRLLKAVFEVVSPQQEDKNIIYEEELPVHLVPYKHRKSPYRGIGTAFAIDQNRFVSAAHVFDLDSPSLLGPLKLRDINGKIYEIDQIHRYSQHRDLIEFSLKKAPPDVEPLKIAPELRIGQFVFTAGNALGDGIVTRSGYITSFTPEPVNGDWNDIRYSAPASPGNSGGPLLNKNLEVMGIVVRRTENENLNFAIPFSELGKVKKAEFFFQDAAISIFKKRLSRDWKFTFPLPTDSVTLTKAANEDYLKFYKNIQSDFNKKFKDDIFPTAPSLKKWTKDNTAYEYVGFVSKDTNDRWVTDPLDWELVQLSVDRMMLIEKTQNTKSSVFYLERPQKTKLIDFYKDAKGILDVLLKHLNWTRMYAGRKIEIKSYGKPSESFEWRDRFDRKWLTSIWTSLFDDRVLELSCLPTPGGVFCSFFSDPFSGKDLSRLITKRTVDRYVVDYSGKIRDWREWSQLPDEWKLPNGLSNVELDNKGIFSWKVDGYSGKILTNPFNDDAELKLSFASTTDDLLKLRLKSFSFSDKDGDVQLKLGSYLKPDEGGNPNYYQTWEKMIEQKPPFNGQLQSQGKYLFLTKILDSSLVKNLKNKNKIQSLPVVSCSFLSSIGEERMREICQDFIKNIQRKE